MSGLYDDEETFSIIGAAMAVHNELGEGFLEAVYQEALSLEFKERHISFEREAKLPVKFKKYTLETYYRADFLCFGSVIVELKAIKAITEKEQAQVINYLKATKLQRGIILNFANKKLEYKRVVLNYK